jgi:hypothetical protein
MTVYYTEYIAYQIYSKKSNKNFWSFFAIKFESTLQY